MSVIELNIKKPTTISAGAVAKDGIAVKIGAKNIDSANSTAAVVVVEVPRTAPAVVATASARSAGFICGSLPFSSSISAFEHTPIRVPKVSKRSTNRKENTTTIKLKIPMLCISTLKH